MNMLDLIHDIVPQELFSMRTDGTFIETAQHLIDQCHPAGTRMRLTVLEGDTAIAEIPYAQENRALHGFMHGGCLFTVGDTLTALLCMFHITSGDQRMLTRDGSIRYLRPISRDTVVAEARLTAREGNQLSFVCDFRNEAGKRAAQAKYRYVLATVPAT